MKLVPNSRVVRNAQPVIGPLDGYADPLQPEVPIPDMPIVVDNIADDELMELFNTFIAWADFLAVEAAKAELVEDKYEDEMTELKAEHVANGKQGELYRDRARAEISDDMRELRLRLRTFKNVRKLLEAKFGNCDRNAKALSRELTRRTTIAESNRGRRYGP